MGNDSNFETEIKLRVPDAAAARRLLEQHGCTVFRPRVFESNVIYDTQDGDLRRRNQLVRVRRVGEEAILTFKSAELPGKHKRREELETHVSDGAVIELILERLGFRPVFRYEKYRTEYHRKEGGVGVVTLDETPIGVFLEIEGPAAWIDETARELGFSESQYVLLSYAALYFEHCRVHNIEPSNMVFPRTPGVIAALKPRAD